MKHTQVALRVLKLPNTRASLHVRSYKTHQIELQILRKEHPSLAKEQIRVETKKKV